MKKHLTVIIIVITLIVIFAVLFVFQRYPQVIGQLYFNKEAEEFSILIFLATVAIALIAYAELTWSNKITENEFLLNISNKWGGESIIRARRILHRLFVATYRGKKHRHKCKCCRYKDAMADVSDHVFSLREKQGQEGDEFIDLLNLLDFMEIIGFFWKRRNIDLDDIDGLFGNSIVFFYLSFKRFIENRQNYEKNYYINFCNLSKKIIQKNEISICQCKIKST